MKSLLPSKFTTVALALLLGANLACLTARADEKETELGGKMKIIGKSLKALKTQISDPAQQQSTIQLLETAKTAAVDARKLTPSKSAEIPEADRAKFETDYQAQMDKLIEQFGKIEDAVKAGKYDDASKLYGDLNGIKRDGHKAFQSDKE